MIFADKIIALRKKNGWSQEELAEKMSTSRQAVSKWEGAQSVPDIGKILQLAQLFGVTTDYLLKEEIESEEYCEEQDEPSVKRVSLSVASEYLEQRRDASKKISLATFLCVLSPIPLILLGAASELTDFGINENTAGAIGLISMLVLVAVAVVIFLLCGFKNAQYEFLEKEPFINEYGVKGMVQEKQKAYKNTYVKFNTIGVCLCILAPIALFVGAFTEKEFFTVVMLGVTIFIAGIATLFFITAGVRMESMRRLLKEGEHTAQAKKAKSVKETVSTVYWLLSVAIYLGISFATDAWNTSWIVWPVAGVVYAAVVAICDYVTSRKNDSD